MSIQESVKLIFPREDQLKKCLNNTPHIASLYKENGATDVLARILGNQSGTPEQLLQLFLAQNRNSNTIAVEFYPDRARWTIKQATQAARDAETLFVSALPLQDCVKIKIERSEPSDRKN